MHQSPSDPCVLYDAEDAVRLPNGRPTGTVSALPRSWQTIGWWMAGAAFTVLWTIESWSTTGSSLEKEDLGHWVGKVWGLLLAVAVCYGIFTFCKPRHRRLGLALCLISAVVLLLQPMA